MTNKLSQFEILPIKENKVGLYKIEEILTEDSNAFTSSLSAQMKLFEEYMKISEYDREHFYIVACNSEHRIKGFLLLNIGELNHVEYDAKRLILFLLLIDADEFYSIHNHPNHKLKGSEGDKLTNNVMFATGISLGIPYVGGYVIDRDGFVDTTTDVVKSYYEED